MYFFVFLYFFCVQKWLRAVKIYLHAKFRASLLYFVIVLIAGAQVFFYFCIFVLLYFVIVLIAGAQVFLYFCILYFFCFLHFLHFFAFFCVFVFLYFFVLYFVLLYFCTFVFLYFLYFVIWFDSPYELPCKIWSL